MPGAMPASAKSARVKELMNADWRISRSVSALPAGSG
jgi:hypothetical protein